MSSEKYGVMASELLHHSHNLADIERGTNAAELQRQPSARSLAAARRVINHAIDSLRSQ
jgi:hypothetical protein